jgi:hypothetical protein
MKHQVSVGVLAARDGGDLVNCLGHPWGATDAELQDPLPDDALALHPMAA